MSPLRDSQTTNKSLVGYLNEVMFSAHLHLVGFSLAFDHLPEKLDLSRRARQNRTETKTGSTTIALLELKDLPEMHQKHAWWVSSWHAFVRTYGPQDSLPTCTLFPS